LFSIGLSWSQNLSGGFEKLTKVDLVFFCSFLIEFFSSISHFNNSIFFFFFIYSVFQILSLNINLFGNWVSYLFSIYFLWSYHDLMDLVFSPSISTLNIGYVGNEAFLYIYIKLSWSHLGHRSNRIAQLTWDVFFSYFLINCFPFHLSALSWLEFGLNNCFFFLSMRLSWSNNPSWLWLIRSWPS
jgi:hypothetical protein